MTPAQAATKVKMTAILLPESSIVHVPFPPSNSARQFAVDRLISPESHEERCRYLRLYQLELKGEFGRKPAIVLPNIGSA
jgi:hypothetical protein